MVSLDNFEDDIIDAPRCNGRKMLVSLFVQEIIESNSNYKKQLTLEDIIDRLDSYPYAISIERKALARDINVLVTEFPFIKKGSKGIYFDKTAA